MILTSFSLFFAAYVICKKNYSFSRVMLLLFQSEIANSFHSKINASRQQHSEAVGPGSNLCRVKYFYDFTDIYDFTQQNRDNPLLLLVKKILIPEILWKTGGFPYQVFRFGPVRQNFFRQYCDARYQSFFQTQKSSPTNFFGTET